MVGKEQFSMPFKQKQLELKVDHIRKPKLEAPWTETIMATPIKPGGQFPHNLVPSSKLKFAEKMSQSMTMSMLPPADLTTSMFPSVPRGHPMSQSTAAGFCLGTAITEADAMAQSLLIDEMMESSQLARTSRPDTLRGVGMMMTGDTIVPVQPAQVMINAPSQLSSQMMSMSMAPQVMAPIAPMAQNMINYDFAPVRRQLDEMARRSLPPSRLPTVPELGSPAVNSHHEENLMTQSRLFQQFSAAKQINEMVLPRGVGGVVGAAGAVGGAHVLPLQSQERLFQQRVAAAPGFQNGAQIPNQSMVPQGVPMSHQIRPQSIAGLPQAQPQVPQQLQRPVSAPTGMGVQFVPVCRYEDSQAIRATGFHPSGRYFALGTNSKQLHICLYPDTKRTQSRPMAYEQTKNAEIAVTRPKQHRGSVYCLSFNPNGDLLATGSNDKTIRLMAFNEDSCRIGAEMELTCHDGTVRDLIFIESSINRSTILVSGGAGNCHLNVTDCNTGQLIQSMKGHTAPILGLYTWSQAGNQFVSCSQDKTIRFWDLRQQTAVNVISPGSNKSHSEFFN
ncbi:WD_REPEATS_REGION domain-containing protein [Caenorhabditis elegans]|uniref:WD_REPEATS_REGION domain-containing protein n=1 Tax=Caenorhabditis elegans TaxID=6239 RepID=H2KZG8_CAEEL|nr:WD_REPEATS_REGION domain-containing protein [Caenorhabditis elegans]CCD68119.1 WD_REPEATS_REGION domain-containing protein [Caenorhabditis elegans]|eukprot:NP_491867.2 NeMiTiN (neuronal enriched MAP interacting protein) homolog [Caenorhabditis elegans]